MSVVLLAGGVGKRMGASIPKQYLDLRGQPIATYSLQTFARMREVSEIVIVCDPSWRDVFAKVIPSLPSTVRFAWALPGAERQDSVFNGLQQVRTGEVADERGWRGGARGVVHRRPRRRIFSGKNARARRAP